jgi:hypothetical protein
MSSNIEQGTKTLGQALGLAAQPVTPGFPAKDQQEESKGVTGAYAGPLRVEGGSKQLGVTASKIESLVRDINGSNPTAQPQTPVTITVTPGVSPTTPSVGPAVQGPSVGSHNPLINPMMPSRDPLAGPAAPVVSSGNQPGGLIGAIKQLTHTSPMKKTPFTTITGAQTDNPLARSATGASKRQLADVSGIEDAGQSSAEKGLEA